jgi:hypothetical protein
MKGKDEEWSVKFDEKTFDHVLEVWRRFKKSLAEKENDTSVEEDNRIAAYLTIAYFAKANFMRPAWVVELPKTKKGEKDDGR